MAKILLRPVIVVAVNLLSGQQQTSIILSNQTSKFWKTQNMKLLAHNLSFPEHLNLSNLVKN
jgi:hypothetical protein